VPEAVEGEEHKKKYMTYTRNSKRPNIHTGLHHHATMDEYGMPSNVDVLIFEDEHR
jgi:hypothetical protein